MMEMGDLNLIGQLRNIARLIRLLELCLLFVLLSWIFNRLPSAVRVSGDYFSRLLSLLLCPLSVFLIGNVIVVTLLVKSGLFFVQKNPLPEEAGRADLFDEFGNFCEDFSVYRTGGSFPVPVLVPEAEIVYQDKQTILEVKSSRIGGQRGPKSGSGGTRAILASGDTISEKHYGKLRRSKTQKCRKVVNPGEIPAEAVYCMDGLSNEDFKKKIESFIATQIKFHREEKLAIVLHGQD